MIDFALLEKLLDLLNRSHAQTIEIRKGFWSTTIRVSKGGLANPGTPVTYQVSAEGAVPSTSVSSGSPQSAVGEEEKAGEAAPSADLLDIKSPMVGTFYAQPEPGADPYVRVGSRVKPGETLCIIEAMKIMNPIDSEVSGVIREVLIDDGQSVEFGQILFRVNANA
ncbi:MAG: acetyl-CoA carboxylase biotin carboxyl carrier protein [Gemmatimonadetes bacterium]|nr:acetyl-CoA carboxylase biotin carboxyl carrier protein [Gemmatimonadota bacterium]